MCGCWPPAPIFFERFLVYNVNNHNRLKQKQSLITINLRMKTLLGIIILLLTTASQADAVPFSKYKLLSRDMNEAEVLYRLGPPDHETVMTDYFHNIISQTWYYIPNKRQSSSRRWISEITFDSTGKISRLNRYKP